MHPDSHTCVRAFISYAHMDRARAAQAKSLLDGAGFSPFLAHEDLEVSDEWRTCLVEELKTCQLFVPLLSKAYMASAWAVQETGFIASRLPDVVVAPLSLDGTRASGFVQHIQSPSVGPAAITRQLLIEPLTSKFPRTILPRAIATAISATDFRSAEVFMAPLVRFFPLFTPDEAQAFAVGATKNGQVWSASLCAKLYLPQFIASCGHHVEPKSLRALAHQVEHDEWYPGPASRVAE